MDEFFTYGGADTHVPSELLTKVEIEDYIKVFPEIMQELNKLSLNTYPASSGMSQMTDWMSKVVSYNMSSKPRLLGGLLAPAAHKSISATKASKESLRLAYIMGWRLEISHGAKLMADNIMDKNCSLNICEEKPAWHTLDQVGMAAVNDTFVMKVASYNILKIYFSDKPYYYQLQDSERDGYQKMVLGRALWEEMEKESCLTDSYTLERYKQIISYMTSYYSFYMPVEFALILAGLYEDDIELKANLKELMLQIGYYHQLVTEFRNILGKRKYWLDSANGKMRRLTWFFVKAMQMTTGNQVGKLVNLTNGTGDLEKSNAENLRKFYIEMNLIEKFGEEKWNVFAIIQENIRDLSKYPHISLNFFHWVLAEIDSDS